MSTQVSAEIRNQWFDNFVVDGAGFPTSQLAHELIKFLFDRRNESHDALSMGCKLHAHPELAATMCRQLLAIDVVVQLPTIHGYRWQYNVELCDPEIQSKVENALAEIAVHPAMYHNLPEWPPGYLPPSHKHRMEYFKRLER